MRNTTTKYESLADADHPENAIKSSANWKPIPYPCNRWCLKIVSNSVGKEISREIMPWLDECKDKMIPCGSYADRDGKPQVHYRPHDGFDEIEYIVIEEKAFKFDADGNIMTEKAEGSEEMVPVTDFSYVAGINSVNFIAEHMFKLAAVVMGNNRHLMSAFQSVNNNLVSIAKMASYIIKKSETGKSIDEIQDQSALPEHLKG